MGDPPSTPLFVMMKVVIALLVLATVCSASEGPEHEIHQGVVQQADDQEPVEEQHVAYQVPERTVIEPTAEQVHVVSHENLDYAHAKVIGYQRAYTQHEVAQRVKVVKEVKPRFMKVVTTTKVAEAKPKVVVVPRPVPVPVPVKEHEHCDIKISTCFANNFQVKAPTFTVPVTAFSGSYRTMCSVEIAAKTKVVEKKQKKEMANKELCKKSEVNQKLSESKMKLMIKKEKFTKAVAEGKEKYLEKKIKGATENAAKIVGQTMEFRKKQEEKQNKKEDELYSKECTSKEVAFKSVREGKEKVKVVYVKAIPKKTPAPAPVVAPVVHHITQVINKVVPVPTTPAVEKTVSYVPAPSVTETHVVADNSHELLYKNEEKSHKAELKSKELLGKSERTGKEEVHKESAQKTTHHHVVVVAPKSNEGACKEKESKEGNQKSEVEQKLAVEKVRKEASKKEQAKKVGMIKKPKPCNPVTSLEKYVKSVKKHEELFAKTKLQNEAAIKEVKTKSDQNVEQITCKMTRDVCKKIFTVSHLNDESVEKIVSEHTAKFEAAMAEAAKLDADAEAKMKYNICESAASDVKYFVRHYLPKFVLV